MNLQLIQNRSTFEPKKGTQRNPYVGPLHPQTKKRHGKGSYQYPNKFFQYQGEYRQGKKHGFGQLKMNDGTILQANFVDDQIQGQAKITYSDGSVYHGQFSFGQKNGKGIFKSMFQTYQGEWKQNSREGQGKWQNTSTGQTYEGNFKKNKFHGKGSLKSYNYSYIGEWNNGKKQGQGFQQSLWRRAQDQQSEKSPQQQNNSLQIKKKNYEAYQYQGYFLNDQFSGRGKYSSKVTSYIYEGEFSDGLPKNYPNQFRVFMTSNHKTETGEEKQTEKVLLQQGSVIQYQLEGSSKNFYVECVYQGPEYLDEIQPTEEEIEDMIKNWQNQNKKNKNPPPMPDFRAPKMKKPQLVIIDEENHRDIKFTFEAQGVEQTDKRLKIDYRQQIAQRRIEIEKIKQQQKKNEEEDPKKKGGKKEVKNENEFKINLYKQVPKPQEKLLRILTTKGACCFRGFQLPDDFPHGKFLLTINSDFEDFGKIPSRKIEISTKPKQAAGKKK